MSWVTSMDELPRQEHSGWTFPKVIGAIVGIIGMVGFGVCSLCGMVIGIDGNYSDVWMFVVVGAVLALLCGWLMVTMFRKAREDREALRERDRSGRPDLRDP
jgi:cytochrome bd-type quinol oxidase subunit 1